MRTKPKIQSNDAIKELERITEDQYPRSGIRIFCGLIDKALDEYTGQSIYCPAPNELTDYPAIVARIRDAYREEGGWTVTITNQGGWPGLIFE